MKLSIGMIVKNEERNLERCLLSLRPILDSIKAELIIVDTGSIDSTVQIAQKYTNRVYQHSWNNSFADMRNITVGYARGEWFGFFDADEVIEDPSGIITFFKTNAHKKYNAGCVPITNIMHQSEEGRSVGYALRFFRNEKGFGFEGVVHEQAIFKYPICNIPAKIMHFGYLSTDKRLMEEKYRRNVELIQSVLEKDPENIYHWYQLSQSYGMFKERKQSLDAVRKAYEILTLKNESKEKYIYILYHLTKTYFNNDMHHECIKMATEGIGINNKYIDFHYCRASSYYALRDYKNAISGFENYLALVHEYDRNCGYIDLSVTHVTINLKDNAYKALCNCYKMLNKFDRALEYAKKLAGTVRYGDVLPCIIDIYLQTKQLVQLKKLYEEIVSLNPEWELVLTRHLEGMQNGMSPAEKLELMALFQDCNSAYGLLNLVRRNILPACTQNPDQLYQRITGLELDKCDPYYGDLLSYIVLRNYPLLPALSLVSDSHIQSYFRYLLGKNKGEINYLAEYLHRYENIHEEFSTDESIRVLCCLCRCVLLYGDLDDDEYEEVFQLYIEKGSKYLELVYSPHVFMHEKAVWTRNGSDGFLLYMSLAQKMEENSPEYIRLLKKAVQQDKDMERGVRFLVGRIAADSHNNSAVGEELASHKKVILQSIEGCLNNNDLASAKSLVEEYEAAVGTDPELESVKAVILVLDENYEEAKKLLENALERFGDSYDLLYNLIYISEQMNEDIQALETRLEGVLGTRRGINPDCAENFFELLHERNIRYLSLDYLRKASLCESRATGIHLLVHEEDRAVISRFFVPYNQQVDDADSVWVHTLSDAEQQLWGIPFPKEIKTTVWENRKQSKDGLYFLDQEFLRLIATNTHDTIHNITWSAEFLKTVFLRLSFKPVITIETFAYNSEKYIEKCLESVIQQKFTDFEWIILDNGSNDRTSAILLEAAKKDYRIKLYRNKVNTITHNAQPNPSFMGYRSELSCEYYTRIDSDDYLHPDYLLDLYSLAKGKDADFAVGGVIAFKDWNPAEQSQIWESNFNLDDISLLGDVFPKAYGSFSVFWNKLYRMPIVAQVWDYRKKNPLKLQNAGDTLFNMDCLRIAKSVAGTDKALYFYRLRKDSLYQSQLNKNRQSEFIKVFHEVISLLRLWGKDTPPNVRFMAAELFRSMNNLMNIAASPVAATSKLRREVVASIIENKEVREVLGQHGFWDRLAKRAEAILREIEQTTINE